jgi:1-deoxy-D-xylulose-5-phosphate reductoisomerase
MKRVTILGSTGSIGRSALDFIALNRGGFEAAALTANTSVEVLKAQALQFRPQVVAVADPAAWKEFSGWVRERARSDFGGRPPRVLPGEEGVCEAAAFDGADFVISSIVGASGLKPTLAAISAGKDIGLANKETLVMAGRLVMKEVSRRGVKLLPVDSEHSAIFQCLEGRRRADVRRLILTASGGPFFGMNAEKLSGVTVRDALNHPKWSMGSKITVDSATMMNKGLEVIEAHHLFGFGREEIDVLVHPQSIVHSLVEFTDGALLAQMSVPDMKGPIGYALSYPQRAEGAMKRLRLEEIGPLTFHPPDTENFPCLSLACEALSIGGAMPAVLNAANEVLVELFLAGRIHFTRIPVIIERVMSMHKLSNSGEADELDAILEADAWARKAVGEALN